MANSWVYGPLGVDLKNNIKQLWWKRFVQQRDDMVGIDAALIMNPKVWQASGHLATFNDPLVECKKCHSRYRADQMPEKCESCGGKEFTDAKQFNLMFKTFIGPAEEEANIAYFRPETAQAMFVQFKNVLDTSRKTLPFGIAQIGKAFRNEITPGDFLFRQREFEQMELQMFVLPSQAGEVYADWKERRMAWHQRYFTKTKLRFREHGANERAHYAKEAWDIAAEQNIENVPVKISPAIGRYYR
jgi:glycyl-tRNA synthetase